MELEATLVSPNRSIGASLLTRSNLAETVFPGFDSKKMNLAVKVLSQLPKKVDFPLALACLFAACPTEFALQKCRVLKLSRSQTKQIKFLLANRDKLLEDKMSLAELKLTLTQPYFRDLYEMQRAIQKAERKSIAPLNRLRRRIKALGDIELRPKPLLDGHELMRLGAVPGPGLGQLAQEMYIAQLEGNLQNAAQARQWVQQWLQKHRTIDK
jgi:poly(A) polymerase